MSEENEQYPTSNQNSPRTPSSLAFLPVEEFIPEDFRNFFSNSEYAMLFPFSKAFNARDMITISASARETVFDQNQLKFDTLRTRSRRPYNHPWSDAIREPYRPRTEDELFDAVILEFTECLGQNLDDAAQNFMSQYDSTAVEDNIAAFESEFLDGLSKVDAPLCRVTFQPPEQDIAFLAKKAWKILRANIFLAVESEDPFPFQLGSIEYFVCVVGSCAISSPKQQRKDFLLMDRCCKSYVRS
jgi:hypothetical protein